MFIPVVDPNEKNCFRGLYKLPENKELALALREIRDVYENPSDFDVNDENLQPEEILEKLGCQLQNWTDVDLSRDDVEDE